MTAPAIAPALATPSASAGVPWSGPIAAEGIFTGDGRKFDPGSLYWEGLPAPLRWTPEDFGAHDGAIHVGWIETMARNDATGLIDATGTAFDEDFIAFMGKAKRIGVSIDPDMAEFDIVIPQDAQPPDAVPEPGVPTPVLEEQQIFSKARIRAATCVDIPAFIEAQITLTDNALVATGYLELTTAVEFATAVPPVGKPTDSNPLEPQIKYAGLALQAQDTGRVLMLQRCLSDATDPAAGLWEFPGGGLNDGEDPYEGAMREFAEEVGTPVPAEADNGGTAWDLPPDNPKYRLHLATVPSESVIDLNSNAVKNPDDPHGDNPESVAWWDPAHIQGDHIRQEVLDAMPHIDLATKEPVVTTPTKPPVKPAAPPVHPAPPAPKDDPTDTGLNDSDKKFLDALGTLLNEDEGTALDFTPDVAALVKEIRSKADAIDPPDDAAPTAADELTASAAPVAPPSDWFVPFELDGPTPLTVTADGRVFGHAATWDSCHRGLSSSGKCLKPPSDPKAPFFQLGQVLTADGSLVDVGVVTVGGGHFTKNGVMTTLEHHDDVTAAAAAVVVKEDSYGVGIFGSITPDATPAMVASLRRSPVSGAWRKEKGAWRLKGIHCVNDPGYPVARGLVASATPNSFVSFGRVDREFGETDLRAVAQRLAKSVGLDNESLVASARARMSNVDCGCDDSEDD